MWPHAHLLRKQGPPWLPLFEPHTFFGSPAYVVASQILTDCKVVVASAVSDETPPIRSPGTRCVHTNTVFIVTRLGGWSFGVRIPGPVQDANSSTSKPKPLAKVIFVFFPDLESI